MARTSCQRASVIAPRAAGDGRRPRSACTARLPGGGGYGLTARLIHRPCERNAARARLRGDFSIRTIDRYGIQGMERLPRHAGGVGNPVLIRVRIATGSSALFDQCLVRTRELGAHGCQFLRRVDLEPQMVDPDGVAALGNREVDAWMIEHPLGVVGLSNRRFRGEQRGVEADTLGNIANGHIHVKSLHARFLFGSAAESMGTAHADPQSLSARLQQLSVKNWSK